MVPLALWSAAVILAVAATTLLADDRKNLRLLTQYFLGPSMSEPLEPPVAMTDETPVLASNTSPLLTIPPIETKALVRLASAEERCKSLGQADQEAPTYLKTEVFSQCTLLYVVSEGRRSQSVFIQIQTDQAGMVSSFRLKLNTEGETSSTIVQKGLHFLQVFGGFFLSTEEFISVLSSRIDRWEDFQFVFGPYSVEMNQEHLDPTRFNVFGHLHQPNTLTGDMWRDEQGSTFRN